MKSVKDELKQFTKDFEVEETLQKNYQLALSDPDFLNMVKALKIDSSIAMQYTTDIKHVVNDLRECSKCVGLDSCRISSKGFSPRAIYREKSVEVTYVPCKYNQVFVEKQRRNKFIFSKDIPEGILSARISDVYAESIEKQKAFKKVVEFIHNFEEDSRQKGLYIYGPFGVGKTYLLAAMLNELAKHYVNSAIIYYPEMIRALDGLRKSFSGEYNEQFSMLKRIPVLVIDDIGAENMTPWSRDEVLSPLLQYRLQQKLPTFFTSNHTLKSLHQHFADEGYGRTATLRAERVIDRITALTEYFEIKGHNHRQE